MSPASEPPRFCARCGGGLVGRPASDAEPPRLGCPGCGRVAYLDPRLVSAAVCVLDGGIVLVRRAIEPERGRWVIPGGFVDRGESVQDAAVREMREEAGLRVALLGILDVYSYTGDEIVVAVYAADVLGGELTAGDEVSEARVFAPEELPWDELAFRSTRDSLRDYLRRYYPRVRVPR